MFLVHNEFTPLRECSHILSDRFHFQMWFQWSNFKVGLCVCSSYTCRLWLTSMPSLAFLLMHYCLRHSAVSPSTISVGFLFFCSTVADTAVSLCLLLYMWLRHSISTKKSIFYIVGVEHFFRHCSKLLFNVTSKWQRRNGAGKFEDRRGRDLPIATVLV